MPGNARARRGRWSWFASMQPVYGLCGRLRRAVLRIATGFPECAMNRSCLAIAAVPLVATASDRKTAQQRVYSVEGRQRRPTTPTHAAQPEPQDPRHSTTSRAMSSNASASKPPTTPKAVESQPRDGRPRQPCCAPRRRPARRVGRHQRATRKSHLANPAPKPERSSQTELKPGRRSRRAYCPPAQP